MRNLYNTGRAVLLGSLLVLGLMVGVSAPAWAVNVGGCGVFIAGTRFDLTQNIITAAPAGACLTFPSNAVVYMNGFAVVGLNIDNPTSGIVLGSDSFLWGPGIVREFGTCVSAGDHVAVEGIVTNRCATGIIAKNSYKIKEVRVHDCVSSNGPNIGISLGQGGFIESSIVRFCESGVVTGQNNKIWNLVVTKHEFTGLEVDGGNAVSRTVISQPRSSGTIGLDYTACSLALGCQDGSNSIDGHAPGNNIQAGIVVTQPQETPTQGATNCSGLPVTRFPLNGRMFTAALGGAC